MRGMLAFYAPTHNVTHPRDNMEDEFPLPGAAELLWTGFLLGGSIFAGAALLELTVVNTVRAIISTAEGLNLYTTAWMHNAINHLILAPIIYLIGAKLFGSAASRPLGTHMLYSAGVLFVHGIGYYITHRAMHTKALWWAHRFHHKFNKHICPIAAAAVTQTEYVLAYLIPFVMAAAILAPMPVSALQITGLFIGHVNNFLHTPWMEELSEKYAPWWWVGASDHFDHHRQLTTTYAAPTINFDRLIGLSSSLETAVVRLSAATFGSPIGRNSKKCE